ncbi:MAG: M20/M25/M40 family metallo-hydrolase [Bacteroidetes bacterium]|nr:M20/M25/M40 family metallo-hydrolase [Bacteroidota bacterium]
MRGQSIHNLSDFPVSNTVSPAASLLSNYVHIASETGNEKEAADFMMLQCRNKGLVIEKITYKKGSYNFAASLYPLNLHKPNIIFLNHMDVVPSGDPANWKHPPYEGFIDDGKVWGRGSLDMKGPAIIQLSAIERFVQLAQKEDLPYNVTLLCVSGEETGGAKGSAIVAKNFKELFTPAIVIGEGGSGIEKVSFLPKGKTYFGVSIIEKKPLWLKLSCSLHSAGHASIVGKNYANLHLINGLHKLVMMRQPIKMTSEAMLMFRSTGNIVGGLRGFTIKHINWLIFKPFLNHYVYQNPELESILCNTITVSNLGNADASPNQNAQKATALVDCRLLPGTSPEEMINFINRKIKDTLLHVSIVQQGPNQITTQPEFFFEKLAKAIKQTYTNAEVVPILFPASNDNSYYRAAGCPVYGLNPIIMSPLQIKSIHNNDEYIELEKIDKGIEVLETFLRSILILPDATRSSTTMHQQ